MLDWSTVLWIPSIVLTVTGGLGLDKTHDIIHQQQLVLTSPWKSGVVCGIPETVSMTWYDDSGRVVATGNETVATCGRAVIPDIDKKYKLTVEAHLKINAATPITATWTLAPQYEFPIPLLLEQPGADGLKPAQRWLFSDVNYSFTPVSNGPAPPYSYSASFVAVKIINPQPSSVGVTIAMGPDSGSISSTHYTIPAYGQQYIRLEGILGSFKGQVVVQGDTSTQKILVWSSWWEYPVPNATPPNADNSKSIPSIRLLQPVAFDM